MTPAQILSIALISMRLDFGLRSRLRSGFSGSAEAYMIHKLLDNPCRICLVQSQPHIEAAGSPKYFQSSEAAVWLSQM